MKKEKSLKKVSNKNKKTVWLILLFLLSISFLIVGCVLCGVYYKNFYVYERLVNNWPGGPGFKDYVSTYNSNYDSNKNSTGNTWVYASYSLFALGLSFIIIGVLSTSGSIYLKIRKSKNKIQPNNDNDSNVQKNKNIKAKQININKRKI